MGDDIENLFRKAVTGEAGQKSTQRFLHRKLLESLLYWITHTLTGITFAINILSGFGKSPLQIH